MTNKSTETKKPVELKDADLDKVAGGFKAGADLSIKPSTNKVGSTAGSNPDGFSSTASSNPDGVASSAGANPEGVFSRVSTNPEGIK